MSGLALAARYWREGLIGLLLVALGAVVIIDALRLQRCESTRKDAEHALKQTKDDYKTAQIVAASDNKAAIRRIEQANAARTTEITDGLERQLADARARGDAYVQRLRDQAATAGRSTGHPGTPDQANTAAPADGTRGAALLADDVRVCTDNTVKLQGWQDYWNGLIW